VSGEKELARRKILIIDDEEDLIALAGHVLSMVRPDMEIISARDGASGIQRARVDHPAVIILDVMMPGIDGYEVCRRLKADPETQGIPLVMLTASSDPKLNEKAFGAGAIACLTKPYNQRALVSCVEAALASGERSRSRPA
jgi:CheY-like chemotaxis protein